MFGREPQGLAAVDNNPDLCRVRPANLSKVGADTSSLHVIQSFKAHSGAGPLPGIEFLRVSSESDSSSLFVRFVSDTNLSRRVAGKSYHLFEEVVTFAAILVILEFSFGSVKMSFPVSLFPPSCGKVDLRTHDPKQFFAVFQDVSAQILAQSWVIPKPR